MLLSPALTIALLASGNTQDRLPTCKVSVFAVDRKGDRSARPFLRPEHFASITDAGIGISGGPSWRFVLTPEGKAINAAYTKAHRGEKIALYCGSREILRPTIAGESSGEFVVESP